MRISVLVVVYVFFTGKALFAQTNVVLGKVGHQVIDQNFIDVMQILNPEFGYTPDSAAFAQRLFKAYSLIEANAEKARIKKLNENSEVKKNIELIRQLAEDRYLSFLLGKGTDIIYGATDEEALAYYNVHSALYTIPGTYSYFVATISDTVSHPIADVKKQLKQYASFVTDEFKAGDGNSLQISFQKDKKLTPDFSEFEMMSKLRENDFAEIVTKENTKVLYLLIKKTASQIDPFQSVKENCKGNVINEKRIRANDDFVKSVWEQFPLLLNEQYFKIHSQQK